MLNLFWFLFVVALSAYVGAVHSKKILKWSKKLDEFFDKTKAKRQRREDIRKKYGFDKTYDKYIA